MGQPSPPRAPLRIRMNAAMASVFIAAIVCSFSFMGMLLVTKTITFDQFEYFCAGVAGFVVAKLLPAAISYYRELPSQPAPFVIETDSDPPSKGGSGGT